MTANEIRSKYIKFFIERDHKEIPPAPIVPPEDPTTLFTSSGMQQLVPFLKGQQHPMGTRLVDSQPCFRAVDIEKAGNNRSLTFFEMLGNWSLGDYFKEKQLAWFWEFLTKELRLPKEKLYIAVFDGDENIKVHRKGVYQSLTPDVESISAWKKLGVPQKRIFHYGVKENWWSRSGPPDKMPPGEIGGPDSEIFFEFTQVKHDPKFGKECHPNCECGRFLEIGNSVFIQYLKRKDGSLEELPQKSVDFGGGLERLVAAAIDNPDVFQIELFSGLRANLIKKVEHDLTQVREKRVRIFLDHSRAATFLIAEGLVPGKNERESVLRRLVRRGDDQLTILKLDNEFYWKEAIYHFKEVYKDIYSDLWNQEKIFGIIIEELKKYGTVFKNLEKEKQELTQLKKSSPSISTASVAAGPVIFRYQSTLGVPGTASEVLVREVGLIPDLAMRSYQKRMKQHKELSRTASAGMFKGGLADQSEATIKLHTTTHLLHQALREVLGKHVRQEGSNVTAERLRFDFSHPKALTDEEVSKVEELINQKIKEDLPVHKTIEAKDQALKSGALAFFKETYPKRVSVYTISKDPKVNWFSKELCGGPHVKSTGEIGKIIITKQQSIGTGLRRIYAQLNSKR